MSTVYMSQLSTLPLMEGEQDQGLLPAPFHVAIAKDPPILFPFMITNPVHVDQLQGQSSYGDQHLRQHVLPDSTQQFTDRMMMSGSEVVFHRRPSPFRQTTIQSIDADMIQRSACDPYDIVENKHIKGLSSGGWAASSSSSPSPPAKMKIMRKASTSKYPEAKGGAARKPRRRAQAHQDESQQLLMQQAMGGVVVRVCSDCSTTKTPLWRSGPCGPKSLCNACGIRQRKARRAMAAAAAATNGGGAPPQAVSVAAQQPKPAKEKRSNHVDRSSLPFKKRCKMVVVDHAGGATTDEATTTPAETAAPTKDQADHVDKVAAATVSLESKIASPPPPAMSFHAFPADEITDAAMLLMTLSCGLVHS